MSVMSPATFETVADPDNNVNLAGFDPDEFEDYDEYLRYRRAEAAERQANVVENTARSAEFIVDCIIFGLLVWVLLEGSEVVSRKLSLGY